MMKTSKPKTQSQFFEQVDNNEETMCPCCATKFNVTYKRPLYRSMVDALVLLSKSRNAQQIWPASVGDFAKLRFFGLIEQGEYVGTWHITESGWDFLKGKMDVPKYMLIRNNKVVGHSDTFVFIDEIV